MNAPDPIVIYALAGVIYFSNLPETYVAGSCVATCSLDLVTVCNLQGEIIVVQDYHYIWQSSTGPGFVSAESCVAYLNAQFTSSTAGSGGVQPDVGYVVQVTNGQTIIPIPRAPTNLASARLVVNGAQYRAPHITINPGTLTLVWDGLFPLSSTDEVYVAYS